MASSSTTGILNPTPSKIMGTRSTRHSSSVDSLIRPEFRSRPWTTKKTIRYDAVAAPHNYGSFALCSLDHEAVEAYRHGHRILEVLLDVSVAGSPHNPSPGDANKGASHNTLADDFVRSEAAVAAANAIRSDLDVARMAVERAQRTLSCGLQRPFRSQILSELHLDPVCRSLLSAVDTTATWAAGAATALPPAVVPVSVGSPSRARGSTSNTPDAELDAEGLRRRPRLGDP